MNHYTILWAPDSRVWSKGSLSRSKLGFLPSPGCFNGWSQMVASSLVLLISRSFDHPDDTLLLSLSLVPSLALCSRFKWWNAKRSSQWSLWWRSPPAASHFDWSFSLRHWCICGSFCHQITFNMPDQPLHWTRHLRFPLVSCEGFHTQDCTEIKIEMIAWGDGFFLYCLRVWSHDPTHACQFLNSNWQFPQTQQKTIDATFTNQSQQQQWQQC